MALQKTLTVEFDGGATSIIEDSYIKIITFSGNKERLNVMVGIFKDASSKNPVKTENYHLDYIIEGANPLAQAYTTLKELPEFAGSMDI